MRIGIAVDGSSAAVAGVEFVASLPLSGRDQVTVVAVAEVPVMQSALPFAHAPMVGDLMEELLEVSSERAQSNVDNAVERLIGLPCPVTSAVRSGHPIEVLERFVAEAALDLLVVGPRGRATIGAILLGSVSQTLLHAMPTSILVARPPVTTPRRVLLAIDGSPPSLEATRFLAAFPLPDDADIRVLVSVTSWTDEYDFTAAGNYLEQLAAERTHAAELAQQAIDILTAHGRQATPMIRDGDPKREILDAARAIDADLIVTGARGIGGFKSLVLGSVSRGVSKAASCSTLVVAHGEAERA
jgi:nucleotide-binding universal stress UspA family protein